MKHPPRIVAGLCILSFAMSLSLNAEAQCSRDIECKGDRICVNGNCVDPTTSAGPASAATSQSTAKQSPEYQQPADYPPVPPPSGYWPVPATYQSAGPVYDAPIASRVPDYPFRWYDTVYGHIALTMGFHGRGGGDIGDISGKFKTGLLLAGYIPVSPYLHAGGYFAYSNSDLEGQYYDSFGQYYGSFYDHSDSKKVAFDHYSVGFSLKAGKRISERFWLGFVGDLGFYEAAFNSRALYGVEVSPRIHLDLLALDVGGFKMGPFASFGPSIVPYAVTRLDGQDFRVYLIYIQLLLGITFGT